MVHPKKERNVLNNLWIKIIKEAQCGNIDLYNKDAREYFDGYDNITFEEISGPARLYTYCPKELARKIAQYIEAKN